VILIKKDGDAFIPFIFKIILYKISKELPFITGMRLVKGMTMGFKEV